MKILTSGQIREADRATVIEESISPLDLMERAAEAIAGWICNHVDQVAPLLFICGKGGNGGDGLAVARILFHAGFDCKYFIPYDTSSLLPDTLANYKRLPGGVVRVDGLDAVDCDTVVIDALLGTAVKGSVGDGLSEIIYRINSMPNRKIAIDIPSGLPSEPSDEYGPVVNADETLAIEFPKLSMLQPEYGNHCGRIDIIDIGLSSDFIESAATPYHYADNKIMQSILLRRERVSHKGDYGHALLVCGNRNMIGAAILATGAALRSGCGLVTAHIPYDQRVALQSNHPSAICSFDVAECFSVVPESVERFSAVGVGCGLGQDIRTVAALEALMLRCGGPMVIDADALNIIAQHPHLWHIIPAGSILTPHPGELRRLIGEWSGAADKLSKISGIAARYNIYVIVKGANSVCCTPQREYYFNSTGTPALAKAGAGDVLTGLLTGLLARGYTPLRAALLGVYLHGAAGEKASAYFGDESVNSSDLIDFIGEAFLEITQ